MPRVTGAPGAEAPAVGDADVMSDFFSGVMQLAAEAQRRLTGSRIVRGGSRALAMAVEAGLPPQMAYSVAETSSYTGIPRSTLYREHDEGRIAFLVPRGNERGAMIRVEEVDRWMEENVA